MKLYDKLKIWERIKTAAAAAGGFFVKLYLIIYAAFSNLKVKDMFSRFAARCGKLKNIKFPRVSFNKIRIPHIKWKKIQKPHINFRNIHMPSIRFKSRIRILHIIVFAGLAAGVIWSVVLFVFLIGNTNDGAIALCSALMSFFACALFYIAVNALLKNYPSPQLRYFIFAVFAVAIYSFVALRTPYSPAHDSYDMSGFLSQVLKGEGFSPYARAYLSFTATNKITLFIYSPMVLKLQSVQDGTQALNYIFILAAMFLISGSAWRMFGEKAGELSMLVMIPFVPYIMLTGPYIYPPSIFISALAMFFYQGKKPLSKITAYIAFGILYILRPTALGFMIVYLIVYGILSWKNKKTRFKVIESISLLFVFCVLVNTAAGSWLYSSGRYPYPKLVTSARPWTSELGTRMQGTETGKCTYSAYSKYFDSVSTQFHRLWELYERGNSEDIEQIEFIHKQIDKEIKWRTKNTVLDSSAHIREFIFTKYKNLFGDEYKPYYYMTNISSDDFGKNLSKNYERRYFMYENIMLICVSGGTAAICMLAAYMLFRRKRIPDELRKAIALAAGIIAVFIVFILMTEVGKRLIFDVFTPMLLLICYIGALITRVIQYKVQPKRVSAAAVFLSASMIFAGGVQWLYNLHNMSEMRDVRIQYVNRHIRLVFPKEVRGFYRIWEEDKDAPGEGKTQFLQGKTSVILNAGKFDRNEIELRLPNGDIYMITNLREY